MLLFKELLYIIPVVLIAITLHEFAHGYVSYKLGDPTPKETGRLSLNPFAHLDPVGTLCLIFFRFGWAKPVNVNPTFYKNQKAGMVMVALAGPIMNFILAFIGVLVNGLLFKIYGSSISGSFILETFQTFFYFFSIINIGLAVFNLIPIPPLDGSKVLAAILPTRIYFKYMQYERYFSILLMILLISGALSGVLGFFQLGLMTLFNKIVSFILFL